MIVMGDGVTVLHGTIQQSWSWVINRPVPGINLEELLRQGLRSSILPAILKGK